MQVSGAWLLYKSNSIGDGFLSATLKGFTVCDDREGTAQEFRLAIGMPENIGSIPLHSLAHDAESQHKVDSITRHDNAKLIPTMLILDAKFSQHSTFISLCIQRPQLLVALDFLLVLVEFFVPTIGNVLSNEGDMSSFHEMDATILSESTYKQPSPEISLSPQRPLIVDDERYDHFVYDGDGGLLYLINRQGFNLTMPSSEAIIYVGNGKKLQFKNVTIKVLFSYYILFIVYYCTIFRTFL